MHKPNFHPKELFEPFGPVTDVVVRTTVNSRDVVTPDTVKVVLGEDDDVIAPGRGGGALSLGKCFDKLIIDQHETHGLHTLFNFNVQNNQLIIHSQLKESINMNDPNLLYIYEPDIIF